jgi:hypothetical protein
MKHVYDNTTRSPEAELPLLAGDFRGIELEGSAELVQLTNALIACVRSEALDDFLISKKPDYKNFSLIDDAPATAQELTNALIVEQTLESGERGAFSVRSLGHYTGRALKSATSPFAWGKAAEIKFPTDYKFSVNVALGEVALGLPEVLPIPEEKESFFNQIQIKPLLPKVSNTLDIELFDRGNNPKPRFMPKFGEGFLTDGTCGPTDEKI